MNALNATTRVFPRSLNAFPDERACAVTVYRKPARDSFWTAMVATLVVIGPFVLALLLGWKP